LDKAVLKKEYRWKVYWAVKGQYDGLNYVVETDLQDELALEADLRKLRLKGGGW